MHPFAIWFGDPKNARYLRWELANQQSVIRGGSADVRLLREGAGTARRRAEEGWQAVRKPLASMAPFQLARRMHVRSYEVRAS